MSTLDDAPEHVKRLLCQTLKTVRSEILTSPDKWTQHTYARTVSDIPCRLTDTNAHSFCLLGAVNKALKRGNSTFDETCKVTTLLNRAMEEKADCTVVTFNDTIAKSLDDIHTMCDNIITGLCPEVSRA